MWINVANDVTIQWWWCNHILTCQCHIVMWSIRGHHMSAYLRLAASPKKNDGEAPPPHWSPEFCRLSAAKDAQELGTLASLELGFELALGTHGNPSDSFKFWRFHQNLHHKWIGDSLYGRLFPQKWGLWTWCSWMMHLVAKKDPKAGHVLTPIIPNHQSQH